MAEEQRDQGMEAKAQTPDTEEEDDDDEVESPFDHPAFLPVILWGLAIWFGYDGWFNDADYLRDDLTFNRVGFALWTIGGIYYTIQAVKEIREDRESGT